MSSPIAHTAVGYAVYRMFKKHLPAERLLSMPPKIVWPLIAMCLSLLPDIDLILAWTIESMKEYHNNLTHSLLFSLLISLFLAPILRMLTRLPLKTGFLLTLTCCAMHLLVDLFTRGRGLMLFGPITDARIPPPLILFTGVPWSSDLSSPLYLQMLESDLAFAVVLLLAIRLLTRGIRLNRKRSD